MARKGKKGIVSERIQIFPLVSLVIDGFIVILKGVVCVVQVPAGPDIQRVVHNYMK